MLQKPMGVIGLCGLIMLTACGRYDTGTKYTQPERVSKGLVVILPGIEGESPANHDIRKGLYDAGVPYALVIYRWGSMLPGPGGMLVNQTNVSRNRRVAQELAVEVAQYQANHPDNPVFLIGHSAGGGMVVFMLEELRGQPSARPVDGAFLLSASISANYDLSAALPMTRRGLVNVFNRADSLLDGGTKMFGNVDGDNGESAGRVGFSRRYPTVFERELTNEGIRAEFGRAGSPHFQATKAELISKYAPRWLLSESWPPPLMR